MTEDKESLTLKQAIEIIQNKIDQTSVEAKQIWDNAYGMGAAREASNLDSWVKGAKWALDIVKKIDNSQWHAGTPTEDGMYIVETGDFPYDYQVAIFNKDKFRQRILCGVHTTGWGQLAWVDYVETSSIRRWKYLEK